MDMGRKGEGKGKGRRVWYWYMSSHAIQMPRILKC